MTPTAEAHVQETSSASDLVAAIRRVLENSSEPLTVSKIRASLPTAFRTMNLDELTQQLQRQVAANALMQYPKYRSNQDRFWDRPMRVHIVNLLAAALSERPLAASELRRKLPDYAKTQADAILEEEVAQGRMYRHPSLSSRGGPRFGVEPPSPRDFLRTELTTLFHRLARLGFTHPQLRASAIELLHEEEWAPEQENEMATAEASDGEPDSDSWNDGPTAPPAGTAPTTGQPSQQP